MKLQLLCLLTAALTVAAAPAGAPQGSASVSTVKPKIEHKSTSSKPAPHVTKPNVKPVHMENIDIGQCLSCLSAVTTTVQDCEPILDDWTGWLHWGECINQVISDFGALQNDCLPCLKSF